MEALVGKDFQAVFLAISLALLVVLVGRMLDRHVKALAKKTDNTWDDVLFGTGALKIGIYIAGIVIVDEMKVFSLDWVDTFLDVALVMLVANAVHRMINGLSGKFSQSERARQANVEGFARGVIAVVYVMALVLIVSLIRGQSVVAVAVGLWTFVLGLTFIFQDLVKGLVSGMYFVSSGKIKLGDWITIKRLGIDGEIVDIGLMTSQILQWDKTRITVPTKVFMDGFTNWRHINDVGGRRIKERLWIRPASISNNLSESELVRSFEDVLGVELTPIEAKRIANHTTNLGGLREALLVLIKNKPEVYSNKLTTLVRTLEPTQHGVPLQIYAFSANTEWIAYERIRSQLIEESLYMAHKIFGLEMYELSLSPT